MATLLKDSYAPVFVNGAQHVMLECTNLFSHVYRGVSTSLLRTAFSDVHRVFEGSYPGYRACDTPYHDLEHTMSVTLATMRMVAGAAYEDEALGSGTAEAAVLAALFHDIGFIAHTADTVRCGAQLTQGHEERSAAFAASYLRRQGYDESSIRSVSTFIACTSLSSRPSRMRFQSREEQVAAHILGSADLLAQMSDRLYLEKLPLLYLELRDAGIQDYASAFELLSRTPGFFRQVAQPRLEQEFENAARFAGAYFLWFENQPRNLYLEYIHKNMEYVPTALECGPDSWWTALRRAGVVERALEQLTA